MQRWLVDDLKGPLVIYEKKVGKFYTALAAPSQAEHWWLVRSFSSLAVFVPRNNRNLPI